MLPLLTSCKRLLTTNFASSAKNVQINLQLHHFAPKWKCQKHYYLVFQSSNRLHNFVQQQQQCHYYTTKVRSNHILEKFTGCSISQCRHYSHSKDKPKQNKKNVIINENEMAEVMDVELFKSVLEQEIIEMKDEFTKQLTIRGASGALESLQVEFDGDTYPLQELAQIGRKNPQLVVLNLSSLPDACQPVIKAILESGMNLNPQQEGTTIYVPLPKVTREHREFLAKNAKVMFVKYKTNLQAVQNKFVKDVKNQKDISEDTVFSVIQQIMKVTEKYVAEAEKLTTLKQKELLDTTK